MATDVLDQPLSVELILCETARCAPLAHRVEHRTFNPAGRVRVPDGAFSRADRALLKPSAGPSPSGANLDLPRREHPQKLSRQPLTHLPNSKPTTSPITGASFRSLKSVCSPTAVSGQSPRANPSDVRLGVVVPFNSRSHRLAPPDRDHASGQRTVVVRVFVDDDKAPPMTSQPGLPIMAPPSTCPLSTAASTSLRGTRSALSSTWSVSSRRPNLQARRRRLSTTTEAAPGHHADLWDGFVTANRKRYARPIREAPAP
jgi:hypothetical protein